MKFRLNFVGKKRFVVNSVAMHDPHIEVTFKPSIFFLVGVANPCGQLEPVVKSA